MSDWHGGLFNGQAGMTWCSPGRDSRGAVWCWCRGPGDRVAICQANQKIEKMASAYMALWVGEG